MFVNAVTLTVIGILAIRLLAESVLEVINNRHALKHRESIPEAFRGFIDLTTYQRSITYTVAKSRFASFCDCFDFLLSTVILLYGVFPYLFCYGTVHWGSSIWGQALTFFVINFLMSLFSLPFDWWRLFHLEERFGFNRSTPGLFWSDRLKSWALGFLLEFPILSLLVALFSYYPQSWWIFAWAALLLFRIVLIVIYPLLILPLFNKLTPLPEGELRERLFELAHKTQFPVDKIYTIDGSKRSAHSNAFFTGIGRFRHVVLYDTLLHQLSTDEIVAVLAHEIGHYKLRHIRRDLVIEGFMSLIGFATLYYLSIAPWFLSGLGFSTSYTFVPLVLIFSMVIPGITFWLQPLFNELSRRFEYEADAFAKKALGNPNTLISGLKVLHEQNLSNLLPHPLFCFFYYSHPTLLEREKALKQTSL